MTSKDGGDMHQTGSSAEHVSAEHAKARGGRDGKHGIGEVDDADTPPFGVDDDGDNRDHADHDESVDDTLNGYWDAVVARLRDQRRAHGIAHADAQWVAEPFRVWSDNLDRGEGGLSRDHAAALAVGMHESLAIRDALIVSLVTRREQCDERRMIAFASHPHDPANVRGMYRLLDQAFNDEHAAPQARRCRSGLAMVAGITAMAPDRLCVQPLALTGYIRWWMGEDEGLSFALRALRRDAGCTLASIVRSAYEHDIRPASARRHTMPEDEAENRHGT